LPVRIDQEHILAQVRTAAERTLESHVDQEDDGVGPARREGCCNFGPQSESPSAPMTAGPDGPLLLCYDGSDDARHAIERAGALLGGRYALVLTVWQPTHGLGSFAWAGATANMVDFFKLDRAAAEDAGNVAQAGARIAQDAGLKAEPVAVEATGPVWKTIVQLADQRDAATIVMGSRGLTGMRSMLLGSVSSAVVHHADRPTLVIRRPSDDAHVH
jgi:nucleotide-binding universal stress UspA family protein